MHKEIPVYSFTESEGAPYTPWVWCHGEYTDDVEHFGFWGPALYRVDGVKPFIVRWSDDVQVGDMHAKAYDIIEYMGKVANKFVEGIGCIDNGILPVVCVDELDSLDITMLSRFMSSEGETLYDNPDVPEEWMKIIRDHFTGIGEVQTDADGWCSPETRIFDLQGRELTAPVPGQPYIKGGKVKIEL